MLSSKVKSFIISHSLALLLWRQTQSLLSDSGHHTNILKRKFRRKEVSDTAGKMFCKMKDPWRTITYTSLWSTRYEEEWLLLYKTQRK